MSITASNESPVLGDASLGVKLDVEVHGAARVCSRVLADLRRTIREESRLTPAGYDRVKRSEPIGIGLPHAAQEGLVVVHARVELRRSGSSVGAS